jgi:hypothetical protein
MGLYEEIWMSGAFAKNYNFDLEERTYFAVETDAGNPGMFNGARLVTKGAQPINGLKLLICCLLKKKELISLKLSPC